MPMGEVNLEFNEDETAADVNAENTETVDLDDEEDIDIADEDVEESDEDINIDDEDDDEE